MNVLRVWIVDDMTTIVSPLNMYDTITWALGQGYSEDIKDGMDECDIYEDGMWYRLGTETEVVNQRGNAYEYQLFGDVDMFEGFLHTWTCYDDIIKRDYIDITEPEIISVTQS